MSKNYFKQIKNSHGSSIMMILVISSTLSILAGFLADRLITQQKMSRDLRTNVSYTIAIQSLTDYAKVALKQKWCFYVKGDPGVFDANEYESDLLPQADTINPLTPNSKTDTCLNNYTHPLSVTRLLLPRKYAEKIAENKLSPTLQSLAVGIFPTGYLSQLTYEEKLKTLVHEMSSDLGVGEPIGFSMYADVNSFGPNHPLKQVMLNAKGKDPIKYVRVKYEQSNSISLPQTGDQNYIKITTELLDKNKKILQNGSLKASESTLIFAAPRELNYFSLVLGGSLILNQSSSTNTEGNGYIPTVSGSAIGVNFYSPIFINKNLILPVGSNPTKSPVTFFEPVTFGSGFIAQGTSGYTHDSPLGTIDNWEDTNLFGGMAQGYNTDDTEDEGLKAIIQPLNTTQDEEKLKLVNHCVNQLREKNAPASTQTSQLFATLDPDVAFTPHSAQSGAVRRKYQFAFLKNNVTGLQKVFVPQVPAINSDLSLSVGLTYNKLGTIEYGGANTNPLIKAELSDDYMNNVVPANRTFSFMVDILYRNITRIKIPIPDQFSVTPGEVKVKFYVPLSLNFTTLTIRSTNVLINGIIQPHIKNLEFEFDDISRIGNEPIHYIRVTGMDNTCQDGECLSAPAGSGSFKTVYLRRFREFDPPNTIPAVNPNQIAQANCSTEKIYLQSSYADNTGQCLPYTELNLVDFTQFSFPDLVYNVGDYNIKCASSGNTSNNFASGAVETYFNQHSADGWEFKHKKIITKDTNDNIISIEYPNLTFSDHNSNTSTSAGIYNECRVPNTVKRVIGNFMCKKLIIESGRQVPLTLIGTYIVLERLEISADAAATGLSFYSIHHPKAIEILKDAKILAIETISIDTNTGLETTNYESCNTLTEKNELLNRPHWHPDPGLKTLSNRVKCSPISTFNNGSPEKFPFRWTSVSADCVRFKIDACAANMSNCATASLSESDPVCIKKIRNYFFKDIDRRYVQ